VSQDGPDAQSAAPRSGRTRAPSEIEIASARVASIVEAAEQAAEDIRRQTEARANDRIAEADRASQLRVDAAEAESRDLLEEARKEGERLKAEAKAAVAHIHERAAKARFDADQHKEATVREARDEAAAVKAEAEAYAAEITRRAKSDARDVIGEAHGVAGEVMREGTQLSGNLTDLSASLRKNAERLLRDVHLAHARLTAELDQATPVVGSGPLVGAPTDDDDEPRRGVDGPPPGASAEGRGRGRRGRRGSSPESPDDFDVPEFLPRS
jgi:hypothetical protein